jgi:aryl-alcohol dehydrogenase-like predicted oxidoreductase
MIASRTLGRTGRSVFPIGFGAWGIGGATDGQTSYGATDDRASLEALQTAMALGINFYDTAALYGYGKSEQLIGESFSSRRDRAIIATKAGYLRYDQPADFSPASLTRSLMDSLSRLKTDHIDLFQLHNPAPSDLIEQPFILGTLQKLQREGLIRSIGASVKSPMDGLTIINHFDVDALQINFNMMDLRALETGLLDRAVERNIAIIARTPLAFGFLSGSVTRDTVFPEGDHRRKLPPSQIARWIEGSNRLFEVADQPDTQTRSQIALRFCLSFEGISVVIPGMLTADEVRANIFAAELGPLPLDAVERILNIYRQYTFAEPA